MSARIAYSQTSKVRPESREGAPNVCRMVDHYDLDVIQMAEAEELHAVIRKNVEVLGYGE